MSTSPASEPSRLISKSEYYSSLPWFRRCLAMLNWRPVVDYELREIEFENRRIEFENRRIAHEQRMKQLASEIEQLRSENARLAAIESRLARFEREHLSSSNPLSSIGDSSP